MPTSLGDLVATIRVDDATVDAALDDLKTQLEAVRQRAQALEAQFKAGAIGADALSDGLTECATDANVLQARFHALEAESGRVAAGMNRVGGGMAGSGRAALQASYAFQDFAQGGFAAILNNIPGIVQSLGGGPGLAGIIGGVGVAAIFAKPLLEALVKALEPTKVEEFRDRIAALEGVIKSAEERGKTGITLYVDDLAVRTAREEIDRLKHAHDTLMAQMGKQTEFEHKSGVAVERALTSPEGRQALAEAETRRRAELEKDSGDLRGNRGQQAAAEAKIKKLQFEHAAEGEGAMKAARADLERLRDQERKIHAALAEQAKADLGGLVDRAKTGVGGAQAGAQERLRKALGGLTPTKAGALVAGRLAGATPEAVEEDEAQQEETKEDQEAGRRLLKKGRAERKQALRRKVEAENRAELANIDEAGRRAHDAELDRQKRVKAQEDQNKVIGRQLRGEVNRADRKAAAARRRKPRALGAGGRRVAMSLPPPVGGLPPIRPGGGGDAHGGLGQLVELTRDVKHTLETQNKILTEIKRTPKPGYTV